MRKMAATYAPEPMPRNMNPSWEMVEYASTFLMSSWAQAMVAANRAVAAPMMAMVVSTAGADTDRIGLIRAMRYTPAVTMVAAWMRADTGVGPSMASGSHTYRGSWADFPHAVMNISRPTALAVAAENGWAKTVL